MSPEQTNLTSAGDVLAGARPNASIAALRDAISEKEAAGPPLGSTQGILSLLREYWRTFRKRRQRKRSCVGLHELSDRELKDIGLTPDDNYIFAHRAIERLRDATMYLSRS